MICSTSYPNESKANIINATIMQSHFWKECEVFELDTNTRLHKNNIDQQSTNQIRQFAEWISQIGDGAISCS